MSRSAGAVLGGSSALGGLLLAEAGGVGLELCPVGSFPGGVEGDDEGGHGADDEQGAAAGDLADGGGFEDVDPFVPDLAAVGVAEPAAGLPAAAFLEASADEQRRPFQGVFGFEAAEDGEGGGVVEQGGGGFAPPELGLGGGLQGVVDADAAAGGVGQGVGQVGEWADGGDLVEDGGERWGEPFPPGRRHCR